MWTRPATEFLAGARMHTRSRRVLQVTALPASRGPGDVVGELVDAGDLPAPPA
ncbi:hypothetical protein [Lentzea guizhouensis]|uniref:hypothetical protein n=1 Tax=Lentzea guizhouensis TaxID=1586287 RepID=UPI0012B68026|nr:hypothetical protein [Lentzea guizhouensis]